MVRSRKWALGLLGFLLIGTSIWAWTLQDLREHTILFEILFFSAFLLYGISCFLILDKDQVINRWIPFGILGISILMQLPLVFMNPTLSDDMYRYVWDGRVQSQGISPYLYPPDAQEVSYLRDENIYPQINRKSVVTVYPPAAEASFALLWRIWPDNVHWFQIVMAAGGLTAGILLMRLLNDLKISPARALIYLWSPLLVFETAHSAHVDGLLLPFLVGALWARVREKDGLTGFLLGLATAMKFYPALLLPFLWRPLHPKGRWQMPLAFGFTVILCYLPYTLSNGGNVLGFLPNYITEQFNTSPLLNFLNYILGGFNLGISNLLIAIVFIIIVISAIWVIRHPESDPKTILQRCILPIGAVTLFSQNLFSWYMLWLLPLIAIFLEPSNMRLGILQFPRFDAWTGWWLFCGLIGLSYTFFINWKPVNAAILAQYLPLYLFLLIEFMRNFDVRKFTTKVLP